jgi:preprotein translocase subunit SecD
MFESFRTRSRMARKPTFAVVYTLFALMISLCLACATRSEAGAPCPVIEMSAVVDTQTDSSKTVPLNDTTTILISRTPLVATGDITGVTASGTGGQWVLNFTVTADAAKRVHEFSRQHVGTSMALVADGKVYGTPRIVGEISGGYRIDGFNQADAERMATAINKGCRR